MQHSGLHPLSSSSRQDDTSLRRFAVLRHYQQNDVANLHEVARQEAFFFGRAGGGDAAEQGVDALAAGVVDYRDVGT